MLYHSNLQWNVSHYSHGKELALFKRFSIDTRIGSYRIRACCTEAVNNEEKKKRSG